MLQQFHKSINIASDFSIHQLLILNHLFWLLWSIYNGIFISSVRRSCCLRIFRTSRTRIIGNALQQRKNLLHSLFLHFVLRYCNIEYLTILCILLILILPTVNSLVPVLSWHCLLFSNLQSSPPTESSPRFMLQISLPSVVGVANPNFQMPVRLFSTAGSMQFSS